MPRRQVRRGLFVWRHLTETAEREAALTLAATRAAERALVPPPLAASEEDFLLWALQGALQEQCAADASDLAARAQEEERIFWAARRARGQADRIVERLGARERAETRRRRRRTEEGGP